MLIRVVILLSVLSIIPSTICRHIDRKSEKEHVQKRSSVKDESSNSKRQLPKTHLRIPVKPVKNLHVREGDNDFLECQATGSPAPTVHWLKDGKIISQSESSEEFHESASDNDANVVRHPDISFVMAKLYLDCLSVEDEAEYTCVAENPYHRTSTSTRVTVSSSDEEISCSKNLHGKSPRLYLSTRTIIGNQGQDTTLTCRADGYPRPTIRWLGSQGEELATADFNKYEILSNGDLIIRDLEWSDLGTYYCIAENVHGEARTEVFLYPAVVDQ